MFRGSCSAGAGADRAFRTTRIVENISLKSRSGTSRQCSGSRRHLQRLLAAVGCGLAIASAGCFRQVTLQEVPASEIETTLLLIGDAGEQDPRRVGAPLDSLYAQAVAAPTRTIIVFLGDNIYPAGVPEEGAAEWADARRRLDAQVKAVPQGVRGIFIPGNHDWANATAFGLYAVRLQERMLASLAQGRDVRQLPTNGCPGPTTIDVGRLRLITLDTQWWLHGFIVKDSSSVCYGATTASVTAALRQEVRPPGDGRVVLVAAHHPLMTGGPHGGYCGVTGPFRRFGGLSQDIISSANRTMRDSIRAAFIGHPPLAYVAGHDHNLQVLRGGVDVNYILVSGAGSAAKTECAVRLRESYYVSQQKTGFMRIDIMKKKGVLLRVFRYPASKTGALAYSSWLEPQ